MRGADLLASTRGGNAPGFKAHDRPITTDLPDWMWGTDGTATLTREGQATIFTAVDHFTQKCIGIHSALQGTRYGAPEPIRQGHPGALRQLHLPGGPRPGAPPRQRQPVRFELLPAGAEVSPGPRFGWTTGWHDERVNQEEAK